MRRCLLCRGKDVGKKVESNNKQLEQIDFSGILASTVHDMKNSLGLLLSTLDEVMTECTPQSCPVYAQFSKLQYEAKRVNNDLIQLLTLYRIDNSQYTPNIASYSVSEFIEENVLENKPLLDFNAITIDVDCSNDLVWFFDRDLMSGVVNNVMNNAFRYTKDKLRLSAKEENGYLVLQIEDNGRGYPEQILHSRGRPQNPISFRSGSTGLGLYFAATVARLHRNQDKEGFVETRNGGAYGGGCFVIYLP